jgi:hypothetical protein
MPPPRNSIHLSQVLLCKYTELVTCGENFYCISVRKVNLSFMTEVLVSTVEQHQSQVLGLLYLFYTLKMWIELSSVTSCIQWIFSSKHINCFIIYASTGIVENFCLNVSLICVAVMSVCKYLIRVSPWGWLSL